MSNATLELHIVGIRRYHVVLEILLYTMGETQMGRYRFSSWTLHMASIIIFSTLWGITLKEWRGIGKRTKALVALTLLVLVGSTIIVGFGNYLGIQHTHQKRPRESRELQL